MLKTDEQIKDVKDALRLDLFSQLSGVGVLNPDCGSCLWHKVEFQTFLLSLPLVIHVEIKADVAVTESLFAYANRLTVINPSNFVGSLQYIGSLFRVDEPVPDDSRVVRPANSVENPWHGCQS